MPELPDVEVYLECLRPRVLNRPLERIRLFSPFLVRSVEPPPAAVEGKKVLTLGRLGKRLLLGLEDDLFLVLHLMIAGRLRWKKPGARSPGKAGLAAFDFPEGTLLLTEAGSKKRASLHVVRGQAGLEEHRRPGLEIFAIDGETFRERLLSENHTLKRALTDPRLFSAIGNAYSDEILHRAGLSPVRWTSRLEEQDVQRLFESCRAVLAEWTARLRAQVGDGFPDRVTAFHPQMAVHGRYGKPCPDCGSPVQRIVYAANECNYCAPCQTEGKLLADRALSRLLNKDWPRTLTEMEERKKG